MIKNIVIAALLAVTATFGATKAAEAHDAKENVWVSHDRGIITKKVRNDGVDCIILAERFNGPAYPIAITCDWNK